VPGVRPYETLLAKGEGNTPGRGVQGVRGGTGARLLPVQPDAERHMRYRLDVVASSVVDVVKFAGGWVFDRSMAGRDVAVLLTDHPDDRPLHILG
jgi:hypothetical protein